VVIVRVCSLNMVIIFFVSETDNIHLGNDTDDDCEEEKTTGM